MNRLCECAGASREATKVAQHSGTPLPGADSRDHIGARADIQRACAVPRLGLRRAHHCVHDLSQHDHLQARDEWSPTRRAGQEGPRAAVVALHSLRGADPAHRLRPGRLRPRRPEGAQGRRAALVPSRIPDLDGERLLPARRPNTQDVQEVL